MSNRATMKKEKNKNNKRWKYNGKWNEQNDRKMKRFREAQE